MEEIQAEFERKQAGAQGAVRDMEMRRDIDRERWESVRGDTDTQTHRQKERYTKKERKLYPIIGHNKMIVINQLMLQSRG